MYRIDQCGYAIWAYPRGNAVAKIEHEGAARQRRQNPFRFFEHLGTAANKILWIEVSL